MLPENLVQNQEFDKPILTPSTKADYGLHDEPISKQEIISSNLVEKEIYEKAEEYALNLFAEGQRWANSQGLILVDTKYEFGIFEGELIVIDEIHTPDSSRYRVKDGYEERFKKGAAGSGDAARGSKFATSIFRPGSPFRKGYSDSPRNRSYVVMNNVLYHLHPVKVKRHGVRLSYTLCLGGMSFFLFIVLTITGIWLMFYFRPTEMAYADIQALQTSVAFGSLVRNMHRWGAHLMVLVVFLHMSRVFYHGAYKAPREFNWVIGVILLFLTLFLSFTGYLLPWDQLAIWAVTVGGNMASYTPVFGAQIKFGLFAGLEATTATLLRFYVLHVLFFPFIIVIFMAIHFWRVRKDGGISGPL